MALFTIKGVLILGGLYIIGLVIYGIWKVRQKK